MHPKGFCCWFCIWVCFLLAVLSQKNTTLLYKQQSIFWNINQDIEIHPWSILRDKFHNWHQKSFEAEGLMAWVVSIMRRLNKWKIKPRGTEAFWEREILTRIRFAKIKASFATLLYKQSLKKKKCSGGGGGYRILKNVAKIMKWNTLLPPNLDLSFIIFKLHKTDNICRAGLRLQKWLSKILWLWSVFNNV